jgi:queuosine precursor transporter
MSILFFVLITVVVFLIPLLLCRFGKELLIGLIPILLITGNVFAESFVQIGGQLLSLAIPVYAATFLTTDILSENFGKHMALKGVLIGFIGQVFFLLFAFVMINAPILPDKIEIYKSTVALIPRLVFASFVAYLISQIVDVYIFHRIKRATDGGKLYLRSIGSTTVSQFIDTCIFLLIGFYGSPLFENDKQFLGFLIATWLFKVFVAVIDTPYLYISKKIIVSDETSSK